jgi:hypothetical protein
LGFVNECARHLFDQRLGVALADLAGGRKVGLSAFADERLLIGFSSSAGEDRVLVGVEAGHWLRLVRMHD